MQPDLDIVKDDQVSESDPDVVIDDPEFLKESSDSESEISEKGEDPEVLSDEPLDEE